MWEDLRATARKMGHSACRGIDGMSGVEDRHLTKKGEKLISTSRLST